MTTPNAAAEELADTLKREGDRESSIGFHRNTYWLPIAERVVAAGWRAPAEQIETPEGLAILRTGTVIRSRHGDVGSIDHGPNGEWTGMDTVIHFLDFATASRATVRDMSDPEMAGGFAWTVLHAPADITERPTK